MARPFSAGLISPTNGTLTIKAYNNAFEIVGESEGIIVDEDGLLYAAIVNEINPEDSGYYNWFIDDVPVAGLNGQFDSTLVDVDLSAITTIINSIPAAVWNFRPRTLTDGIIYTMPTMQYGRRTVIAGDTYSSTLRKFPVTVDKGGEFPLDLSLYVWTYTFKKKEENLDEESPDVINGTATIIIATGEGRGIYLNVDGDDTIDADGIYDYEVIGTKIDDETEWTVERGEVTFE
jgi:hypothetical protein